MKIQGLILLLAVWLMQAPAAAMSKMPPDIPIRVEAGQLVADLQPLLTDANDPEITRIFLCRRTASRCYETVWEADLPSGWQQPQLKLLGDYPGANVKTLSPEALQPGGSYNLLIEFKERSRWHKQTVSSLFLEFCLIEDAGAWEVQDKKACLARRNAEKQQGAKP